MNRNLTNFWFSDYDLISDLFLHVRQGFRCSKVACLTRKDSLVQFQSEEQKFVAFCVVQGILNLRKNCLCCKWTHED